MIKLTIVAGARPNFIKIAPIIHALHECGGYKEKIDYRLVHTGQHFDYAMSKSFFEELNIPVPDANLEVSGGSQAEQTSGIMIAFEKELLTFPADIVIVVGDVTSTMACAIVAKKLHVKVVHIEAGIRSYDLSMPEEINRMVTDSITDYFFTTSQRANENLIKAGIDHKNIFFVGNVMIDTLLANLNRVRRPKVAEELALRSQEYIVLTMHRPANVDEGHRLSDYLNEIAVRAHGVPIIFPVHPRTKKALLELSIGQKNLHFIDPLGYLEFIYLIKNAKAIITDSGGITEEATILNVPCLTIRDNTERPETCEIGTNELIGTNLQNIAPALEKLFAGKWKSGSAPEFWDGKSAKRIVNQLLSIGG